jgi:chromosome segregation ATPase
VTTPEFAEARERIRALEREVTDLRVANQSLSNNIAHLTKAVDSLTEVVQGLRDTMNQGRGALWLAMATSGVIGALAVVIGKRILGFD